MNLFNSKSKSNSTDATPSAEPRSLRANVAYARLEPRQVLSASFVFGTGGLILDSFDAGQDLSMAQQSVEIDGITQDAYVFDVASGSWSGSAVNPLVELESVSGGVNNRLEVATAFLGSPTNANLILNGSTTTGSEVGFSQTSSMVTFDSLDISNFTNLDRSLSLNTAGDIAASDLTVADSNPTDGFDPAVDLRIKTQGHVLVGGTLQNLVVNQDAEIILTAEGAASDVVVSSHVETALGNISVRTDDALIVAPTGTLQSGLTGNINVATGLDGLTGTDGDEIRMESGSLMDAGTGQVSLNTVLGGDVKLGTVTTLNAGDAITISSGGNIVDNLDTEAANLVAANGRINLNSDGDIGSSRTADIEVQAKFLRFDSGGEIHLTDNAFGLTVDRTSIAMGGGELRSSDFLTIGADVRVGGSTVFAAGNSASIDDNLTINNDAVVQLIAGSDETLEFFAGDDVVIESGQIVTSGLGEHAVKIAADHEGAADADRGSITNGPGTGAMIVTNDLELVAFDGIGDASSGPTVDRAMRVDVDRLVASNLGPNDLRIDELGSINLVDLSTNNGAIFVTAADSISVSQIDSADDLTLTASDGTIRDNPDGQIKVASHARFVAGSLIELTDLQSDLLQVAGNASFEADNVSVGQDQQAAGSAVALNTFLGSVTINSESAIIVEDDATVLAGVNQVGQLSVASADNLTNLAGTELVVTGHTQLNAPNGIFLGGQTNDSFEFNTLGVVADNVHVELDSSVILDGRAPNQAPADLGKLASHGTEIDQTLFVTSTGSIVQTDGQLDAANFGLKSSEYVHLARIAARNENVAIAAGTAGVLTDATTIQNINALADVVNSEVNPDLPQSIALIHDGTMNVSTVDSPFASQSLAGLTTTDGSIFAEAKNQISIQQDIVAQSPSNDPQVTIYAETGTTANSGIHFDGGKVEVAGPSNIGIVNKLQTTAIFFDQDGFVLPGTTEILVLNTDGTANQDIVVEYADSGESGYRVIIVWDKDNQPGQPVEIINTFVSDPNLDTEEHEDQILKDNESIVRPIGANEGGTETFSKFPVYSKEAVIAHQDNPNVFSTVTIRSDQDINLFSGNLANLDNSLNETTQTLRAEFDAPKRSDPVLPRNNRINPIEIKAAPELPISSNSPDISSSLTFSRDVQPFETGDLKWVLVEIPVTEMETSDGDVILKDPTKIYSPAEDADVNDLDDEIGENEVEKIIREIETDEKAESGYWYKVFKDYRNRDDELFFYHFKTGELQSTDSEPQSDFERRPELPSENDNTDESGNDLEGEDSDRLEPDLEESSQPGIKSGISFDMPRSSSHALSAGSLMMAGLLIHGSKNESQLPLKTTQINGLRPSAWDSKNADPDPPKFGRLDRLKRKIEGIFRRKNRESSTSR